MSRLPDEGDTPDTLPGDTLKPHQFFLRISERSHKNQIFYSCSGRFAAPAARVTTLYLADVLETAVGETICRNAAKCTLEEKFVAQQTLEQLAVYRFEITRTLSVLDFTVANLAKYRLDARIYAEWRDGDPEYEYGPAWAAHAHELRYDGIVYPSRHYTAGTSIALFEHTDREDPVTYTELAPGDDRRLRKILFEEFDWGIRT